MIDTISRIRSWDRESIYDLKALLEEAWSDPVITWGTLHGAYREFSEDGNIENYIIEPCLAETLIGIDRQKRALISWDMCSPPEYRVYKPHNTPRILRRGITYVHSFIHDLINAREREEVEQ